MDGSFLLGRGICRNAPDHSTPWRSGPGRAIGCGYACGPTSGLLGAMGPTLPDRGQTRVRGPHSTEKPAFYSVWVQIENHALEIAGFGQPPSSTYSHQLTRPSYSAALRVLNSRTVFGPLQTPLLLDRVRCRNLNIGPFIQPSRSNPPPLARPRGGSRRTSDAGPGPGPSPPGASGRPPGLPRSVGCHKSNTHPSSKGQSESMHPRVCGASGYSQRRPG